MSNSAEESSRQTRVRYPNFPSGWAIEMTGRGNEVELTQERDGGPHTITLEFEAIPGFIEILEYLSAR